MSEDTVIANTTPKASFRAIRTFAVYLLLGGLLYFALRNAPLVEIWSTLKQLRPWHIAILVCFNVMIYMLITLRWWIIIRAENKRVPYFSLLPLRLATFGVSYFTLGPQVGGEPLQVMYLQRQHGFTYTRATASVVMDKLLEFLANFFLLAVGLTAVFQAGIISFNESRSIMSLIGLVILMMWPPIHIILMVRGQYPVSAFLKFFPKTKTTRFITASEKLAGMFCRRHLSALIFAAVVSLLAGMCMVMEFALLTSFLQIHLSAWQVVASWTAGWLAFLIPLPGGLGALEASLMFALGAFGIPSAGAIGVALLVRTRDLLIGGLGLLFAGNGIRKSPHTASNI